MQWYSRWLKLTIACVGAVVCASILLIAADTARAHSQPAAKHPTSGQIASQPAPNLAASVAITSFADQPMCRFGFAETINPLDAYDPVQLARLRAGWYQNFNTKFTPSRPNGIEFAQTVRVKQLKEPPGEYNSPYVVPYAYGLTPTLNTIANIAQANRGALWMIGVEIERRDWPCRSQNDFCNQDEILPELYADAYHDVYQAIKNADRTAQVANGAMVEVTPLRLKYLDRIWDAYIAKYGTPMPVDVWNMHPYILQEVRDPFSWGADIPAGLTETQGILYLIKDNDNLDYFKQQVVSFRQWMKSKGEQNKPLIISEYGVLFNYRIEDEDGNIFTTARVQNFMYGSFDYLLTAKDPSLGYAADDNRLVQRWNWFSLDFYPDYFSGNLFSYTVRTIDELGLAWAAYVTDTAKPFGPALNLKMLSASYMLGPQPLNPTATVQLKLSNSGFLNWTSPITVQVARTDGTVLARTTLNDLPGCGKTANVQLELSNLTGPVLSLRAQVDPYQQLPDADLSDNTITFTILVSPTNKLYLPLLTR